MPNVLQYCNLDNITWEKPLSLNHGRFNKALILEQPILSGVRVWSCCLVLTWTEDFARQFRRFPLFAVVGMLSLLN